MMKNKYDLLQGIRLLDFTHSPSAVSCIRLLEAYGAETVKIPDTAAFISVDLNDFSGLVTDQPELIHDPDMGWDKFHMQKPDLVYSVISGFGIAGPYARHSSNDAVIQAESGMMSITGEENKAPTLCGAPITNYLGAYMGCIGTLMALIGAAKTGTGRLVDTSILDTQIFGMENLVSAYLKTGIIPHPIGNNYRLSAPVGVFSCKDGSLVISVATDSQWKNFCEVLDHPEWIADPRFSTVQQRLINYKEVNDLVSQVFFHYTYKELSERLQRKSCVYGQINTLDMVLKHPQFISRHKLSPTSDEKLTDLTVPFLVRQ